jgi:uncharacterized membrane protein
MSALVVLSSFLAAGVEWVEALTIVLAVGLFRGWRSALTGMALALGALLALLAVLGLAVASSLSLTVVRTVVGLFLLLFGLNWLHKAILRSSGLRALHDEEAAFAETREQLTRAGTLHWVGVGTAFNGVLLEGLEVVFIVISFGAAQGRFGPAIAGAAFAVVLVLVAGVVVRGPLERVPENTLKFAVGLMLTSFGCFWAAEGAGVDWPGDELSLLGVIAFFVLVSIASVRVLRRRRRAAPVAVGAEA